MTPAAEFVGVRIESKTTTKRVARITCTECKRQFLSKRAWGERRFCSNGCRQKDQNKRMKAEGRCPHCKQPMPPPHRVGRPRKAASTP